MTELAADMIEDKDYFKHIPKILKPAVFFGIVMIHLEEIGKVLRDINEYYA